MSMNASHYVMYGVAVSRNEFPGDIYDDEWLPYIEGDPDVNVSILQGEGDDNLYCGWILGGPYDAWTDGGHQMLTPDYDGILALVHPWLSEKRIPGQPGLMLVTVWV